jgi:hypothetical protein
MPVLIVWINAFIPKNVAGYTKTLAAGPHAGKTAVPLPVVARAWPGNTFKDADAGYLTDQRDFDASPGASVRMQSLAEVEMAVPILKRQVHRSSGTTEVNIATGAQTGFKVADMSRCQFMAVPSKGPANPGGFGAHLAMARGSTLLPGVQSPQRAGPFDAIALKLSAAAGDPLVGMAADIDYVGTFTISGRATPGSLSVSFDGLIDAFPAYECYASFNGMTKQVWKSSPPPGNTVADLLGPANRPISGRADF